MANTSFNKTDKRKITYSASGCETEIDLCLWELQHSLVVVDLDKKVVRKQWIIRRKI